MSTRANFGIDAPGVIRNFLLLALAALLLAWAASRFLPQARGLPRMGASFAVVFCAQAGLMLWTSLVGKRLAARQLLEQAQLRGNARAATEANARALDVAGRVELVDGDMRAMPFADGEFDAVLSSLAVHNVYEGEGREQALREIARVTRPGGRVLLQDFRHTGDYARALRALGFEAVERRLVNPLLMFPPTWRVSGRKPAT